MLQAPLFDGDAFDAGAFGKDGFVPGEVGVRRRHIAQAFVITVVIIVLDERLDLGFEVAGQEVVFEQDAVLQGLVPTLDLALGLRMVRRSAHMFHSAIVEPFGKIAGYVAGAIVAEQPGLVLDVGLTGTSRHPASGFTSLSNARDYPLLLMWRITRCDSQRYSPEARCGTKKPQSLLR